MSKQLFQARYQPGTCRALYLVCFCVVLTSGCSRSDPGQTTGVGGAGTNVDKAQSGEDQTGIESGANSVELDEGAAAGPAVTREELEVQMERHGLNTQWHFGERVPGELAGTWRTVNRGEHPIVFGADGTYSEDFNGQMTKGLYAVSATGRVVAFSKWNGIGLGAHYQFDGITLTGPQGPNPSERWARVSTPNQGEQ